MTPSPGRTEPPDWNRSSHGVDEPCIYSGELSSEPGNDLRPVLGDPGGEAVALHAWIFHRGEGQEGIAIAQPGALRILDRVGRDARRVILALVGEPRLIGLVELQILGAQLAAGEARRPPAFQLAQHVGELVAQALLEPVAERGVGRAAAGEIAARRSRDEFFEGAAERLIGGPLLGGPAGD